jgi:alkylhydroperoxidase/carboxymuconolactone decarboxylase family protein YurZ
MVALIYIGLDASASHLFESGLNTQMQRALEAGASRADVFDVLHLVALQGVAQVCQAADILSECMGWTPDASVGTARQARMDPGYVDMLLDFVEQGHPPQGLSPAERSLVQVAMHACFTAFNPGAVRQLITTALSQGVEKAALLQAIQLGAHLSVHGAALGANVFRSLASGA